MHFIRVLKAGIVVCLDWITFLRERVLSGNCILAVPFVVERLVSSSRRIALWLERLLPWERFPRPIPNHCY